MSDLYQNRALMPLPAKPEHKSEDVQDWGGTRMNIGGPGGNTVVRDHDERGILTQGLWDVMAFHQEAELGSDHNSHREGIYGQSGPHGE